MSEIVSPEVLFLDVFLFIFQIKIFTYLLYSSHFRQYMGTSGRLLLHFAT